VLLADYHGVMDAAGEHNAEEVIENSASGVDAPTDAAGHDTLKYSLLGPSLTKAGQDAVDQRKV
jgi:DNA polymerase kappa